MLSVMFYNGWFIISVILGGGLGYFMFGQTFMKINLQNCQVIKDTYCMQKCDEPGMLILTRNNLWLALLALSGFMVSTLSKV